MILAALSRCVTDKHTNMYCMSRKKTDVRLAGDTVITNHVAFDIQFRGCLHDIGTTFIPARVHSGSLLWLCIRLHDTNTKCHAGASHTGASSPRFLCRSEIFIPARKFIPVSCKRGMTVRFISIKVSSILRHYKTRTPTNTALCKHGATFHLAPEWKSPRYHVNTPLDRVSVWRDFRLDATDDIPCNIFISWRSTVFDSRTKFVAVWQQIALSKVVLFSLQRSEKQFRTLKEYYIHALSKIMCYKK